jgi:drug/metabolite transporter (DMT)-like permease
VARAGRRYWRTIILGILALGVMVWSAVEQFDVPLDEIRQLLLGTVIAVVLVILAAALFVLGWIGLRRLLHRD